jgi:argininosuccinate lyase
MTQIRGEIESGAFEWKLDLEDVHLNIEARLTALVGDAGKRLHTGRSRNDQVATDIRLWLRARSTASSACWATCAALLDLAEKNADTILHLQVHPPAGGAGRSAITSWPMWKCSRAMPSAWPIAAAA